MRSVRIWTMWTLLPDWSQNYARFSYQNFWFSSEIVLSLSRLTFAHRAVQFIIYLLWLENVYLGCSTVLFFGEKRVGNVWQQLVWVQFGIIWNDNFWYCIDRGKIVTVKVRLIVISTEGNSDFSEIQLVPSFHFRVPESFTILTMASVSNDGMPFSSQATSSDPNMIEQLLEERDILRSDKQRMQSKQIIQLFLSNIN